MNIQYASRNPAAPKHNMRPLFQLWSAILKMLSKRAPERDQQKHQKVTKESQERDQKGTRKGPRNGLGTKKAPESCKVRKK